MSVQTTDLPMDGEMIDCETAFRMLWDYLDGHLGPREEAAVRQHVTRCSHCFPHADFARVVLDAVAKVRESQVRESEARDSKARTSQTASPSTALRDRILAQLRAEGYEGP